jgi:K+-transporting ATPase ATPase A chain
MRWVEYIVFLAVVIGLARPVGVYLARVFEGKPTFLDPALRPVESLLYRMLGVRPSREMSARRYTQCFLLFSFFSIGWVFLLLLAQRWLPGGPAGHYLTTSMTWDLALNTAISFSTTATWQAYGGETTLRYLTELIGLVSQNFLAAAAGLALGIAFIRGFARESSNTIGNFWVDLVRGLLWVLLPVSLVGSLVLMWQGVPFNLAPYTQAHTLQGGVQTIAQGPVAALEFIKNLGTNGGGFFNANGAHPYENPTPLANFLGMLAIAVLPASLTIAFGQMTGRPRAGWVLLAVMVVLFAGGLALCDFAEAATPPQLAALHVSGGNMEGKETRFGIGGSVLAAVVTSNGATGSYNSMHDSYQPLGVLVPLVNMLLGEVVFGGLGTGLYGMIMIALVAVLYALLTSKVVLVLTALALAMSAGRAGLVTNGGARGFTEVLFAYASSMANNGQSMAGLNPNNVFFNITTAIAMLAGRFGLAALALALAGRFAAQRRWPTTVGTLPSDSVMFAILVFGTIVLVGALGFLPALALGPLAEALQR